MVLGGGVIILVKLVLVVGVVRGCRVFNVVRGSTWMNTNLTLLVQLNLGASVGSCLLQPI